MPTLLPPHLRIPCSGILVGRHHQLGPLNGAQKAQDQLLGGKGQSNKELQQQGQGQGPKIGAGVVGSLPLPSTLPLIQKGANPTLVAASFLPPSDAAQALGLKPFTITLGCTVELR